MTAKTQERIWSYIGIVILSILVFFCFADAQGQTTTPANSIKITDQSGIAQSNRPFTISRVFAKSEIMRCPQAQVNGATVATQCDVKTHWPDTSVQHALVSFLANLGANATITVTFVDQSPPAATGLTQAQMLALTWNSVIDVTDGTTPLSANARTMLTAGNWSYWLQGPICTQVIVEDRSQSLSFDMGWDAFKPLHPIFVLTFYPGSAAGVKSEMILENDWTTKMEDQHYDLALRLGPNLAPVYSKAGFTQVAQSRWRKTFWDGAQPGTVNIDYNLPYMIYSQALPYWDLSRVVPASSINSDVSSFNGSDKCDLGGHSLWDQYMPGTGGRFDLGLFPVWYVHYLFTFDPRMQDVMLGLAACGAYVPNHLRESATNRFYDSAHTVNAFGYPVSLDGRPDLSLVFGLSAGPDGITPVGPTSTGGWTVDLAHLPAFAYVPYLITGDWYWLEESQFAASEALITGNNNFNFYSRGRTIGWIPYSLQTRGVAWGLRDVAESAFVSPDATPQKTYLTQKLNNNIQVEEGYHNITNGSFPPANPACPNYSPSDTADKWCYGRMIIGEGKTNPLHFVDHGDPYGGGCNGGDTLVPPSDAYGCSYGGQPFEVGYKYGVLGHIQELGFPIGPLNQADFRSLLHQISDPAVNPWLSAVYHTPNYRASTNTYFQTWSDYMLGFNPAAQCGNGTIINWRTITAWNGICNGGSSDSDVINPGYPHIIRMASSFLAGLNVNDGTLNGADAWTWMDAHVCCGAQTGPNPQWEYLPRGTSSGPPIPIPPQPKPIPTGKIVIFTSYVNVLMEQVSGNEIICQVLTQQFPVVNLSCRQYGVVFMTQTMSMGVGKTLTGSLVKPTMDPTYQDNNFVYKISQPSANVIAWDITANAAHSMGQITCGQNGVGCTPLNSKRHKP